MAIVVEMEAWGSITFPSHIPCSGFLNRVLMKLVNFKSIKKVTYIIITVDRQRLTTYLSLNVTQVTESNWKVDFAAKSRVVNM